MNFEQLKELVQAWGEEKKITYAWNTDKQFMKFIEEVFEFKTEMDNYHFQTGTSKNFFYRQMKLEMGDILVTLIILSKQLNIDLVECLELAYNKIKDRKGKTVNGTFVKEEDLK